MTELIKNTLTVSIPLTSLKDILEIFFCPYKHMIQGIKFITLFHKTVENQANADESAYIAINCNNNNLILIGDLHIFHAAPGTKHNLLGTLFSSTLSTSESLRHAQTQLKLLCKYIKGKNTSPPG
jgi:hypothetical protein